MADKNVTTKLILQGESTGLVAEVNKAEASLGGLSSAVARSESSFAGMTRIIPTVAATLGTLKLFDYAKDATMLAARVETLGVVMRVVGNNAGYSGAEMQMYAQQVAQMGITTETSRQSVIKMASSHMDLKKSAELARIAQDAAVIGNINSSEAFDKMIHGITSAQVDVLRTIGINVQFEDSYKKLAIQLGKNQADLTEQEKIQARTNVVLEKGKDIAGAYASSMETAGKLMNSMKRPADEIALSIGGIFTPTLNMLAKDFYGELNKISKSLKDSQPTIESWGNKTLEVAITIKAEFMRLAMLVDKLGGSLTALASRSFTVAGVVTRTMTLGQYGKGLEDRSAGMKAANDMYAARYAATEAELMKLAEKYNQIGTKPAQVAENIREQADSPPPNSNAKKTKGAKPKDLLLEQILSYQKDMEKIRLTGDLESAAMFAEGSFGLAAFNQSAGLTTGSRYKKSGAYSLLGAGPNTSSQPYDLETAYANDISNAATESATRANREQMQAESLESEREFMAMQQEMRGISTDTELLRIDRERQYLEQSWAMNTDSYAVYETRMAQITAYGEQQRSAVRRKETSFQLGLAASGFNSMASIADSFYQLSGKKSKEAFVAYQVMKSGETVVSTADAAMKAYSAMAGIPYVGPVLGAAAAAAAVAAGAVQLQSIWSASPEGGGTLASVSGGAISASPSSDIVTQPVQQPTQPGQQVTIVLNNPIGERRWFEDNLPDIIRDLRSRNVDMGVTYA